jgi:dolichyl-phosphate-mannose--protein O-mannosyl transferase
VVVTSYATYLHNVGFPQGLFWDENYHVASAQRYLHGVFFVEEHPPLGKLLIALGQTLEPGGRRNAHYIDTDHADWSSKDLDFTWYRLLPAALAALTAPLLFGVFYLLSRRLFFALVMSGFYVYDNALVVHARSAMLEGPLLFFVALNLFLFLLLLEFRGFPRRMAILALALGSACGLGLAVKLVGLVMILLLPALLWRLWPDHRVCLRTFVLYTVGFLVAHFGVWMIHFSLVAEINPQLPEEGTYGVSEDYLEILRQGRNGSLLALPVMLRDTWRISKEHHQSVPQLNLCDPKENGSPFFFWPLGARAINYRWETPNGKHYRYLYLQCNPVVWACGLLGVFLASCLVVASWLVPFRRPLKNRFFLTTFLALWGGYMAAVGMIGRVMYLYHYFTPLLVSLVLFGLVVLEVRQLGALKIEEWHQQVFLGGCLVAVLVSFQFYRPLTYYEFITDEALERRALVPLWELHCASCPRAGILTEPCKGS